MKQLVTLILLTGIALSSQAQVPAGKLDFTKEDITQMKKFDARAVSVYGVYLTMTKAEAVAALSRDKSIYWEYDGFNTTSEETTSTTETRIYVYNRKADGEKGSSILYLIWNDGDLSLDRIVFFLDIKPKAVGDTKKLFSLDAVDRESAFYKRFLVKADKHKNEDYTISDEYRSKKLQVIQYKRSGEPNDIYFALDLGLE